MAKVFKKSNLCVVVRKYTDNNGQEKSIWKTIGELTTFQKEDGSYNTIAELYTMPMTVISVFEQKQENKQQPQYQPAPAPQYQQPMTPADHMRQGMQTAQNQEQEINIEHIPF